MNATAATVVTVGAAGAMRYARARRGDAVGATVGIDNSAVGGSVVFVPVRDAWWVAGLSSLHRELGLVPATAQSWSACALKTRERAIAAVGENPDFPTYPAGQPDFELAAMLRKWLGVMNAAKASDLLLVATPPPSWAALTAHLATLSTSIAGRGTPTRTRAVWRDLITAANDADQRGLHDVGVDIPAPGFTEALGNNIGKLPERLGGAASAVASKVAGVAGDAVGALVGKLVGPIAFGLLAYGVYRVVSS